MSALELRLIAYGLGFLILVSGAGFGGYRLAATHYQALMDANRAAQQEAVIAADQKAAAAQAAQQAASVAAEKRYEDLQASAATLGDELATSLREYTALHRSLVPAGAATAPDSHAGAQGSGGDQGIAGLAGQAAQACEDDATKLTALQAWALSISQSR